MNFIGDYFAIGLVVVLCMFYIDPKDPKYILQKNNRFFVLGMLFTVITALTDLWTGHLLTLTHIPLVVHYLANSLYFVLNIATTSFIALYLFHKILEHSHETHCMVYAQRGLVILFSVYLLLILLNPFTDWLFYFDSDSVYCRGPLNAAGYLITILQMVLVLICYIRNRKNANKMMHHALLRTFPVVTICIIIQRIYPEIMLNSMLMAMFHTVLFLTFQSSHLRIHSLTKLNDRYRFFEELESRVRHHEVFQIFWINIKDFGAINQKYGHMAGDEILYQLAFSLEKLYSNCMAFHMNGTVFALILPYTSQHTSEANGNILLDFLDNGIPFAGESIRMNYVVSEYITDERDTDAADLYEKLEYASSLAHSKKLHYIRCSYEIGVEMHRKRYIIERLQTIDKEHGYQVWYQPIKCLDTGIFCSMEALVRLQEPDGRFISPAEFIPIAEETDMISPITWFVLEEVCRTLSSYEELKNVSVSVNLPMRQLLSNSFLLRLNSIVDQYEVNHRQICLEFTERAILDNFELTKNIMEELTAHGYRFYLDDFGTGYSNFNCILQLPFQFIKLDAIMTNASWKGLSNVQFVSTLVSIFHGMNLPVIAEGVETEEEADILKENGVDRIQGYVYAKPMATEALLEFYHRYPV